MKKWNDYFKYYGVTARMLAFFMFLVIVPYICLVIIAFVEFENYSVSSLGETSADTMSMAASNISAAMDECENESMSVYYTGCVDILAKGKKITANEKEQIESVLSSSCFSNTAVYSAYLVTDADIFHGGRRYPEILDVMENYKKEIIAAGGRCLWYPTDKMHGKAGSYKYILARSLNSSTEKNVGILYLLLSDYMAGQIFSHLISDGPVRCLTDSDGRILYSSDENLAGTLIDISPVDKSLLHDYKVISNKKGQKIILASYQLMRTGWFCISMIDIRAAQADVRRLLVPTMLIALVYLLFLFLMLYTMKKYVFQPLRLLKDSMDQYAQDALRETHVEIVGIGEFQSLSEHFNNMTLRISRLMKEYKDEVDEKNRQRIKTLTAQLSPHFIYNALNTIKWVAVLNRQESIQHLVESLVNIFMNAARTEDKNYTLKDELNLIQDYAVIQKARFMNFELIIEADDSCMECQVRKLLIQPVVENAIVHGLNRGKVRNSTIVIKAWTNKNLYITVSDKGTGFDVEKWRISPDKNKEHTNIGIHNIEEIIQLEYGNPYGIQIKSTLGEGTVVMYTLPVVGKES